MMPVCQMKGYCKPKSFWEAAIPCANITAPDIPSPKLQLELNEFCPQVFSHGICCSVDQFNDLKEQFNKLKPFIANCPACVHNFKSLFCATTCGDQSIFNLTEIAPSPSNPNVNVVVNATLSINNQFGEGLYDSCKNIKLAAANTPILDFIGGGAHNWLSLISFLGTKSPMGSPFTFIPNNQSLHSLNDPTVNCNNPNFKCSCSDCPSMCPNCDDLTFTNINLFQQLWLTSVLSLSAFLFFIIFLYKLYHHYKSFNNESTPLLASYSENDLISNTSSHSRPPPSSSSNSLLLNKSTPIWYHLQYLNSKLGFYSAYYHKSILKSLFFYYILISLAYALIKFNFITNPVLLWSNPNSIPNHALMNHNQIFQPFYRIQQLILKSNDASDIISNNNIDLLTTITNDIKAMHVTLNNETTHYSDLCVSVNSNCVIYAMSEYPRNDKPWSEYSDFIHFCLNAPTDLNCLPSFLQPLQSNMVITKHHNALLMTFPMLTHHNPSINTQFELQILNYFKLLNPPQLTPIYATESSVELELSKSTSMDYLAILISYLLMFIYILTTLKLSNAALPTRIIYILFCLSLVIIALLTTFLFMHVIHIHPSFILLEVVPFLILAIGVDNIFLITMEYNNNSTSDSTLLISTIISNIGPNIMCTVLLEAIVFLVCGLLIGTPAIQVFCIYTSVALLINCVMQLVCIPAILALFGTNENIPNIPNTPTRLETLVSTIINKVTMHAKHILYLIIAILVLVAATALTIPPGLNQMDILPHSSYLIAYYGMLPQMDIGIPTYYILYNYTLTNTTIGMTCGLNMCNSNNMVSLLSVLVNGSTSPMDDFIMWMDSECAGTTNPQEIENNGFSYLIGNTSCVVDLFTPGCHKLFDTVDIHRIRSVDYPLLFQMWLNSPLDLRCMHSGKAYPNELHISSNKISIKYRTFVNGITTQNDFITGLSHDIDLSLYLSSKLETGVSTYSPYHVYFDQYLDITYKMVFMMGMVVLMTLIISVIVLGSIRSGMILVVMEVLNTFIMVNISHILGLELNSLLLGNLIMTMGITYEFNSHLVLNYMTTKGDNIDRVKEGYGRVGSTILKGIGMTKLVGVMALGLANSVVFQKYYFVFYLWYVVVVVLSANLVLPVLLVILGDKGYLSIVSEMFDYGEYMDGGDGGDSRTQSQYSE